MNAVAEAPNEAKETALERAVREAVAAAPLLSDDTREQVARLLTKNGGNDA